MNIDELKEILRGDPGNPVFAEYAEELRKQGSLLEAIEAALQGLSANPSYHKGRLVLARAFYDKGFFNFAAREVEALRRALPESAALQKLLEKLAPDEAPRIMPEGEAQKANQTQETIAEAEFDFDDIEQIDDKS